MPTIGKNVSSGKPTKVIIFDQKEEAKKREHHMKIFSVSKYLRESGNQNLYRCVQAVLDPISVKLFSLNAVADSDKAVAEVCFPNKTPEELTDEYCNRIIKETVGDMMVHGYKVLRSKLYRDPQDPENVVGKILVNVADIKVESK